MRTTWLAWCSLWLACGLGCAGEDLLIDDGNACAGERIRCELAPLLEATTTPVIVDAREGGEPHVLWRREVCEERACDRTRVVTHPDGSVTVLGIWSQVPEGPRVRVVRLDADGEERWAHDVLSDAEDEEGFWWSAAADARGEDVVLVAVKIGPRIRVLTFDAAGERARLFETPEANTSLRGAMAWEEDVVVTTEDGLSRFDADGALVWHQTIVGSRGPTSGVLNPFLPDRLAAMDETSFLLLQPNWQLWRFDADGNAMWRSTLAHQFDASLQDAPAYLSVDGQGRIVALKDRYLLARYTISGTDDDASGTVELISRESSQLGAALPHALAIDGMDRPVVLASVPEDEHAWTLRLERYDVERATRESFVVETGLAGPGMSGLQGGPAGELYLHDESGVARIELP